MRFIYVARGSERKNKYYADILLTFWSIPTRRTIKQCEYFRDIDSFEITLNIVCFFDCFEKYWDILLQLIEVHLD